MLQTWGLPFQKGFIQKQEGGEKVGVMTLSLERGHHPYEEG